MFRFRLKFLNRDPLVNMLPEVRGRYLRNISLSRHTWFGVGGEAEIMYIPEDADDLIHFLRHKPRNVPVCLIGGGSNLLVRDGGVPGVVIKLDHPSFKKVTIGDGVITCGAGFRNADLKKYLLKHQLGGLEFLCSIPGVIGGQDQRRLFRPRSQRRDAKRPDRQRRRQNKNRRCDRPWIIVSQQPVSRRLDYPFDHF